MNETERLRRKLDEIGGHLVHVEPGTDPKATAEQRAKAIRESIERIEAGDYEEIK